MGLSEIDRNLLERCLQRKPRAWEDFVDRFMGLVIHVVNHTAQARSMHLAAEDRDDLCASVFLAVVDNDFAILRNFQGQCSLATYLTVITRRIVVRELLSHRSEATLSSGSNESFATAPVDPQPDVEERLSNQEEIVRMLSGLDIAQAEVVRLYHLEGKSYDEISLQTGIPENSIGPILSRAREKLRRAGTNPASNLR
ncbi:MAG TPA: sigma-70 family RNA polymerase sigma factor [Thermoguttaceae bacterium]